MTKPKKHVYMVGDAIAVLVDREIAKVGYEVDLHSVLLEMYKEAAPRWPINPTWDNKHLAMYVWNYHPEMYRLRDRLRLIDRRVEAAWQMLTTPPEDLKDPLYDPMWGEAHNPIPFVASNELGYKLIIKAARARLEKKLKDGTERRLFFEEHSFGDEKEGRWVQFVRSKKRAVLGTYTKASGCGEDWDPPGLKVTSSPLMLEVSKYRGGGPTAWVLAEDCEPWANYEVRQKVAGVLMEDT